MREILFRGKRADNGEWVEGRNILIVRNERGNQKYFVAQTDTPCAIFESEEHSGVFVSTPTFRLIPETVGQYTGLTDKNGKQIFEGDILKGYVYPFFNEEKGEFNYFAEVVWFENSPAFGYVTHKNPLSKVKGASDGDTDYLEDFYSNCWEVIGNIHDNSELIGGDKE